MKVAGVCAVLKAVVYMVKGKGERAVPCWASVLLSNMVLQVVCRSVSQLSRSLPRHPPSRAELVVVNTLEKSKHDPHSAGWM